MSAKARFCRRCGHAIEGDATVRLTPTDLPDDVRQDIFGHLEDLEFGTGALVVTRGPIAGSHFYVAEDVTTIGRNTDSAIFLDDITVSRRHAEIRRRGSRFVIHDVGSLIGTYVNGERVEETELSNTDVLQIGRFRLRFLGRTLGS